VRTLGIHTERFRFESKDKATAAAERVPEGRHAAEVDAECLVVFVSVEKEDEESPVSVSAELAADTLERARRLGVGTVVLYPYVHLTDDPASPRVAIGVLDEVEARLAEPPEGGGGVEVVRAPFGWYKAFEVSCLGHPLSEWSGRYRPGEQMESAVKAAAEKGRVSEFNRFVIVDLDGKAHEVTAEDFADCPVFARKEPVYALLRQFVSNELTSGVVTEGPPKHIAYMRRHELVDYCDVSEKGHYKWYPKGLLMQKLILDYAGQLAREWGAFEMKNPLVIRGDHNVVGELMGEFHERDYIVDGGRGLCYLRYASDPLAFPFMQNVSFSYKQSPLKVYEEATCFRNEQEGEVSGLKRVRNFVMTDMHAACASEEEAREQFETLCLMFAELMNEIIASGRWVLGWEGTSEFFEANRDWLISIGTRMKVPAFFKLSPRMTHYYAIKNEYQSITQDRANIQVSTVQWDVKDGERFDIGFVDEDGRKHPCPVIIHASSFGSIERTLCAILENIAVGAEKGRTPAFPLWLAPTQVRVVPVSERHVEFAAGLCDRIADAQVRADLDERDETVGKKIRNAEREWVPYVLVVGDKEESSGLLTVRTRGQKEQRTMQVAELLAELEAGTEGMPFRPLPLPRRVSQRPIFFG
jgi:threonyl-tRNA synthetase